MDSISVLSLNCHGFNLGTSLYLHRIAKSMDIILLQETWLSDATCSRLSEELNDYTLYHSSSMEQKITTGISCGHPFGGTAVLVPKKLAKQTCHLVTGRSRVTAIRYSLVNGPDIIFCSIYMPWNDNSIDHSIEFDAVIGAMQRVMDKCLGCKFVFGGDFNVSKKFCLVIICVAV